MNFIIFIVCFPEPDQLNSARMPKNNQLPCPKCDGKFSGQFGLKIHMRKKHSDDSISKSPKSLKSKRMSRSRTSMNWDVLIRRSQSFIARMDPAPPITSPNISRQSTTPGRTTLEPTKQSIGRQVSAPKAMKESQPS